MEIEQFERLMGAPFPPAYLECFRKNERKLTERGFDPKTLCVLNLELRESDRDGWAKDRFFLSGDGCGNYYFVPITATAANTKVLLFAHDPSGIEDPRMNLDVFLHHAEPNNRITESIRPGKFCIARAEPVDESILDPISLDEWKEAIASFPNLRYRGFRDGKNPFTGESVRFKMPGMAVCDLDGQEREFRLCWGRISGSYTESLLPTLQKLAHILNARLVIGERS